MSARQLLQTQKQCYEPLRDINSTRFTSSSTAASLARLLLASKDSDLLSAAAIAASLMRSKNKSTRSSSAMSVARRLNAADKMSAPSGIGWFKASTSAGGELRPTEPVRTQAIALHTQKNITKEDESGCRGTCLDDSVRPSVCNTLTCNTKRITSQDSHHPHVSLALTRPKHEIVARRCSRQRRGLRISRRHAHTRRNSQKQKAIAGGLALLSSCSRCPGSRFQRRQRQGQPQESKGSGQICSVFSAV